MDIGAAIRAVSRSDAQDAVDGLTAAEGKLTGMGAFDNEFRVAHMIGQCAHESMRFHARAEVLNYTSVQSIMAVFGRRFQSAAQAAEYVLQPQKLANFVYANRNGNGDVASGDGFRYRGRGWLQLTGRENYRTAGARLDIDLEGSPEKAEEPETAWLIAGDYLARRKSGGKTAFEWADENNVEKVTRIVNGRAMRGLEERRQLTALALRALGGIDTHPTLSEGAEGETVRLLQRALVAKGFPLGALDGDFGPKTRGAVEAFQRSAGLAVTGTADKATWEALEPIPS